MDWGADPGARNHQVEREARSFLKAAGRSKNKKIRELVLGKAREEQGSRGAETQEEATIIVSSPPEVGAACRMLVRAFLL